MRPRAPRASHRRAHAKVRKGVNRTERGVSEWVRKGVNYAEAVTSSARARVERGSEMRAAVCAQQRRGELLGAVAGGGGARRE